jgi:hypothetical protein
VISRALILATPQPPASLWHVRGFSNSQWRQGMHGLATADSCCRLRACAGRLRALKLSDPTLGGVRGPQRNPGNTGAPHHAEAHRAAAAGAARGGRRRGGAAVSGAALAGGPSPLIRAIFAFHPRSR